MSAAAFCVNQRWPHLWGQGTVTAETGGAEGLDRNISPAASWERWHVRNRSAERKKKKVTGL